MMPKQDGAAALNALITGLLNKSKSPPQRGATPTEPTTVTPITSQWRDESIVYLVTTTHCRCGAQSTQTNPIPFVRRFHPKRGVHEEPIALAHGSPTMHLLPVRQDHRSISIDNCHECLSETTQNPCVQADLLHNNPLS